MHRKKHLSRNDVKQARNVEEFEDSISIKPTRCRVYCYSCHKSKMLFESESKALNFIRFNADVIEELNGFAPCRAYYCSICMGWHVTSQETEDEHHTSRAQRYLARIKREQLYRTIVMDINTRLDTIQRNLKNKSYHDCILSLNDVVMSYKGLKNACLRSMPKVNKEKQLIKDRIDFILNKIEQTMVLEIREENQYEQISEDIKPIMSFVESGNLDIAEQQMKCIKERFRTVECTGKLTERRRGLKKSIGEINTMISLAKQSEGALSKYESDINAIKKRIAAGALQGCVTDMISISKKMNASNVPAFMVNRLRQVKDLMLETINEMEEAIATANYCSNNQ